ncbi:hypothetical protein [Moraxella lacunata]
MGRGVFGNVCHLFGVAQKGIIRKRAMANWARNLPNLLPYWIIAPTPF